MPIDPATITWDDAPQQAPAAGPRYGPPPQPSKPKDPYDIQTDQRDFTVDRDDTAFDEASKLRTQFRGLPTYENYDVALQTFNSSLSTAPNAQGDQSLITSYAKMLDPTSAVREGEFETTANTQTMIDQLRAKLAKEFGMDEGGMLTPEGREYVRREMWNLVSNRFRPAFERDRTDYTTLAQRYGYDPMEVVGSDPLASYSDRFKPYMNMGQVEDPNGNERSDEEGLGAGLDVRVSYEGETYDQEKARILAAQWDEMRNRGAGFQVAREGMTLGLQGEASGIGNAISGLLRGDTNVQQNYRIGRDAEDILTNEARGELGWAATPIEVVSSGGGVLARGGSVFAAGRNVAASGQPLTRPAVQSELARMAGRDGMVVGGVGGFGYDQSEDLVGTGANTLAGIALGGAAGYGGQRIGNAISNRAQTAAFNPATAQAVADAGQAEGITVNRAMIDPRLENTFSGVETTGSGPRLNRAMNEIGEQVEGRVNALGGGRTPEREFAGEAAQRGATRSYDNQGQRAGQLYDRADQLAGGTMVQPTRALAEIDAQIAELQASGSNTNRGLISYLTDLRADLAGGMSIRGLRDQRTAMRGQINERNLGMTDAERRVGRVMDSASQDIDDGLQGNAGARALYRQADNLWRERSEFRQQVLRDLRGPENNPNSGEKALGKIQSWMKDDAGRFQRMWRSLEPDEQAELRGHVAQTLGRNAKGEFTPAAFLTHTGNDKGRAASDKALKVIFGDDGFESIKNLRTISEQLNRLDGKRNRSNTERARNYKSWLFDALVGGGGVGTGAAVLSGSGTVGTATALGTAATVGGVKAARNAMTVNMLLNPNITRWLRQAPATANPRAIDAHVALLGRIAKAEPALAGDIDILRRSIANAANDNMASSAVAEDVEE